MTEISEGDRVGFREDLWGRSDSSTASYRVTQVIPRERHVSVRVIREDNGAAFTFSADDLRILGEGELPPWDRNIWKVSVTAPGGAVTEFAVQPEEGRAGDGMLHVLRMAARQRMRALERGEGS